MIADYEGDVTNLFNVNIDGELPILATRNIAIFPGVISPVIIGRKQSLNLLDKLRKHNDAAFAVFCQKDQEVENPEGKDLFEYGVYAKLVKVLEMPGPGNNLTAIIQGLGRCRLKSITRTLPFMLGEVCPAMEDVPKENDKEFATAMEDMRSTTLNYIRMNEDLPDESQFALNNISNNVIAVDFVCTNLPFSIEDKELLISTGSIKERVIQTLRVLHKEMQLLEEIRRCMDPDEKHKLEKELQAAIYDAETGSCLFGRPLMVNGSTMYKYDYVIDDHATEAFTSAWDLSACWLNK